MLPIFSDAFPEPVISSPLNTLPPPSSRGLPAPHSSPPAVSYARRLGLFSATMSVIGGIIGAGIFINPAIVAQRVGTAQLTLGVWILGGTIAMIGAFCFAELGARYPKAGGGYVYIREAFGEIPAFLQAWTLLLVMATGATAAVAFTFAGYAAALIGLPDTAIPWVAVGAIALLSAVNYVGVRPGAITQNIFTVLKLGALAVLIIGGLLAASNGPAMPAGDALRPHGAPGMLLAVGIALVPVLFAYGGWQQTNFIAEELLDAERNLPRALMLGVTAVIVVYVLANFTYLQALGAGGLARSHAPAADTMRALLGPVGATFISAGIAISTFGFLNLVILVSPRVYQTMAADGLFFPQFARLHPRFRTPTTAIVCQGIWAILLLETGTYGQLLDYVVFCDWIFFGLAAATLFVFRRRERRAKGTRSTGFRVPGYPVTPALFVLAAVYAVVGSVASNPGNALRGVLILAAGVPVYFFWRGRRTA
jgi:APA family basic amino acid/polyamine antiporter